jgi:hypothetical protein
MEEIEHLKKEEDRLYDEMQKVRWKRSELYRKYIIGKCYKNSTFKPEDMTMHKILSMDKYGGAMGINVSQYGVYYTSQINHAEHNTEVTEEEFNAYIKKCHKLVINMKVEENP